MGMVVEWDFELAVPRARADPMFEALGAHDFLMAFLLLSYSPS